MGVFKMNLRAFVLALVLTTTNAGLPSSAAAQDAQYDILIRSGTVIDGTGSPGCAADVGVRDGEIVFVGDGADSRAETVIDAAGLVVAPGFLDPHNHIGVTLGGPETHVVSNYVHQGVTTMITGPDGLHPPSVIRDFSDRFRDGGLGPNIAFYVGHGGIRREVMGAAARLPTSEELERMKALVREGMELGAVGMSAGLGAEPGIFSDTDEIVALAAELAPYDGIYNNYERQPVNAFVESEAEAIEIGRRAGVPVLLAHLKGVALQNKGLIRDVIAMVNKARDEGQVVVSDQYPYSAARTLLSVLVMVPGEPEQYRQPYNPARLERLKSLLRNPQRRARLKEVSENGIPGRVSWLKTISYGSVRIMVAPGRPELVGRYLVHIAEERGVDPFDALADLILESDGEWTYITLGAVDEEDLRLQLVEPWNMISSDGGELTGDTPAHNHPRQTGSFPRILGHYTRELGLLSLPEAIRKMTSLPADTLRLHDRGRIEVGKAADIVVFDAERIAARSTWEEPNLYPTGLDHVIVNGVAVLRDGELTEERPGRFIERQSP